MNKSTSLGLATLMSLMPEAVEAKEPKKDDCPQRCAAFVKEGKSIVKDARCAMKLCLEECRIFAEKGLDKDPNLTPLLSPSRWPSVPKIPKMSGVEPMLDELRMQREMEIRRKLSSFGTVRISDKKLFARTSRLETTLDIENSERRKLTLGTLGLTPSLPPQTSPKKPRTPTKRGK